MLQQGEQLILAYLAEVSQAASRYLPPRRRTLYISEVRDRIEAERKAAKGDGIEQVRRVLRRFGDPDELVARECAADGAAEAAADDSDPRGSSQRPPGRRQLGILARPVRLRRAPPPWEGGPRRTRMYRRSRGEGKKRDAKRLPPWEGRTLGFHPGIVFVRLMYAARVHTLDTLAIALYLVSGLVPILTLLWPVAAAQVALSRVWPRRDKVVALGVPVVAALVGMALWDGGAYTYWDDRLLYGLPETGALALRIAAVGCALYLAVRMSRIVRAPNS